MTTADKVRFFGVVLYIAVMFGLLIGWFMNVYKFVKMDFEQPIREEIVRGIGIPFAPIGAIAGWVGSDGK